MKKDTGLNAGLKESGLSEAGLSRRGFLGALGAGLGVTTMAFAERAFAAGEAEAGKFAFASRPGAKAILFDASKCVGCHYCEGNCRNTNELPAEVTFNIKALPETVLPRLMIPPEMRDALAAVQPITEDDRTAERYLRVVQKTLGSPDGEEARSVNARKACTHCGICAQVCPAKALLSRDDGIVAVNADKCIGCFYCQMACPFDIPRYRTEGEDKAVQKCIGCGGLVDEEQSPACVAGCPVDALSFGAYDDMVTAGQKAVSELLAKGYPDANLYGARELGGMGVVNILAYKPRAYGLPELPAR